MSTSSGEGKASSTRLKDESSWARVTCGFCGGRGLYPFGHPRSRAHCAICAGRGWVRVMKPFTKCPACAGRGAIPGRALSCPTCLGRGVLAARLESDLSGGTG
jgi:DnaJ-class molecular chaperone